MPCANGKGCNRAVEPTSGTTRNDAVRRPQHDLAIRTASFTLPGIVVIRRFAVSSGTISRAGLAHGQWGGGIGMPTETVPTEKAGAVLDRERTASPPGLEGGTRQRALGPTLDRRVTVAPSRCAPLEEPPQGHSAKSSSCPSTRPVCPSKIVTPSPCGGAAASFWKKFGNVFFTQLGFRNLIPGTFRPSTAKHIAMR